MLSLKLQPTSGGYATTILSSSLSVRCSSERSESSFAMEVGEVGSIDVQEVLAAALRLASRTLLVAPRNSFLSSARASAYRCFSSSPCPPADVLSVCSCGLSTSSPRQVPCERAGGA